MKVQIIIFAIGLIVSSCSKETDCCLNISADIDISLENVNGDDLLNPNIGSINLNEINVYFLLEDDSKSLVDEPNLDAPKSYLIKEPETNSADYYKILLYLNTVYLNADNISYTYIEWKTEDIDELKAEFSVSGNSKIVEKIWVNGNLKWEKSSIIGLTIIK